MTDKELMQTNCLYKPGELHIYDIVKGDKAIYSNHLGEGIDKILSKGYELMPFSKALELMKIAENEKVVSNWEEITEDRFDEMLNVLPPENWIRQGKYQEFRMCEYYTSDITSHYFKFGDRYFAALRRNTEKFDQHFKEIEKIVSEN